MKPVDIIIADLIIFLGGICFLCHKPFPDGKAWTIHHRKYRIGEKDSRDFKEKVPHKLLRGKNKGKMIMKVIYHKLEYMMYLKPIVMCRPIPTDDFAPLHHSCHQAVSRLARWKLENLDRLYLLAREQKMVVR